MLKKRTSRFDRRTGLIGGAVLVVVVAVTFIVGKTVSSSTGGDPSRTYVSGEPMPRGDLPGWTQTFADDFNEPELGDQWSRYTGTPGGSPQSEWREDHVAVRDSQLVLEGIREDDGRWVTGGASNYPVSQLYGKWEVRFRADASDETTFHLLLWPQQEVWPPEIDFLENFGGDRQSASAFLHYQDSSEPNGRGKTERTVKADFTEWHTAGVEWEPGRVTYVLDGRPWATVEGGNVPDQPMWLGLQAQAVDCQAPESSCSDGLTRADVMIDWVAVYQRS